MGAGAQAAWRGARLRTSRRAIAALTLGWCLSAMALGAPLPRQYRLDLTRPSIAKTETRLRWGCGGGSGGATEKGPVVPPPLPLRMRIISLDAAEYRPGQQVNAYLLITNVGRSPFNFPSSVDQTLIFHPGCTWAPPPGALGLHGLITLVLADQSGHEDFIASHGLYGVSSNSNSYVPLAPGDSILIKTAGKLFLQSTRLRPEGAAQLPAPPHRLTVTARLSVDDTPAFGRFSPVVSANSLRIRIVPR